MKNKIKSSKELRGLLKFTLSTRGLTVDGLARMFGMSGSSLCIAFYRPFPKAERIIAEALNLQPWDIWPERYTNGKPNRPNPWYRRKFGEWTRKSTTVEGITQEKILDEKILDENRNEQTSESERV